MLTTSRELIIQLEKKEVDKIKGALEVLNEIIDILEEECSHDVTIIFNDYDGYYYNKEEIEKTIEWLEKVISS